VKNAKTPEEKAKWKEGGEYKAILHAFASGFTSSLSGNDFLSGAIGDGISQLAQKELANIKDPTLRLFASAAIGAGAAKLVGGNAKIGAISAYNGTKYNDLIHHPTTPGAIVYSDGNPPNHEGRGYYEVQSDGSESYLPDGIKPGDVVWYPNGEYNDNGQQMGNEHIIGDDGKPIAIQWVATQVPVGSSALLQSFVTLYRAVNQETHEDVIVNGGTPMKDDSGTIYNQAVDENGKITLPFGIVAGFVNPGSGISALKGLYGFKVGITASEIKSINNTFGGRIELNGSIESVLENSARYDGFWEKTAAITRSIVNNHTFDNGNKRTAMTVIQELMERNGISTGVTVEGMKDVIYKISTGELKDVNEIAKALRGF
uniref:type II toxin-antitoxin system death-on-curing family toxin n=1 Tax=Anaeroarcus burkinensis TaxID=82376 RepID=UPI0012DF29BE